MVFALILEFPLSKYFYGQADYQSILINTLFPPLLMIVILIFFRVPGESNTKKIYDRIYVCYKQLYDAFGTKNYKGTLYNVMKDLLKIKEETIGS